MIPQPILLLFQNIINDANIKTNAVLYYYLLDGADLRCFQDSSVKSGLTVGLLVWIDWFTAFKVVTLEKRCRLFSK